MRLTRLGRRVLREEGLGGLAVATAGQIIRKIIAGVLILVFMISVAMCNNASASVTIQGADGVNRTFTDVKSTDWFSEHVMVLVSEGIIDGYNDNTFKPSKSVQVDEFIKTMVVALGYSPGNNPDGYWAQLYIDKALELGFVHDSDFTVYDVPINRGDMAMICERVVEMLDGPQTYTKEQEVKNNLTDYEDVRMSGSESAILHVYELGIITGYPDGSFGAKNQLMRSEASTVIHRIIDKEERRAFISDDIERLASYERDTSGKYQPTTEYDEDWKIDIKIDHALGWVNAIYNFDYRTDTYQSYRGELEWYYSPAINWGGQTADVYLDWLYDLWNDSQTIMEAYAVTDKSLLYQNSGGDLVVPVTIYYKIIHSTHPDDWQDRGVWYKYDTELTFVRIGEPSHLADLWEHDSYSFAGENFLSEHVRVGE